MLIGPSKNIANNGKGMYVGLKQPLGDGERCVTPARAAAKETNVTSISKILGVGIPNNNSIHHITRHGRDNLLLGIA